MCQVIKNRYGQSDVNIGMTFHGEIGMFKELPRPEEIGDYAPYLELDYYKVKQINTDEMENDNLFTL